jgi:GH15 family glucan-1,4-alpha-glucosidase
MDEAEALFERLTSLRNHVGLFAEEYEPTLRRQIGNFPQAFTHLAPITTAHGIDAVRAGRRQRFPRRGEIVDGGSADTANAV